MKLRTIGLAFKRIDHGFMDGMGAVRVFDVETGEDISGVRCVTVEWDVKDAVKATIEIYVERLNLMEE